ncbi:MAG: putative lipid II flippase FtsW [Clostridiales bacterium]|nr:putative lipid II flippase FtsW [Candidatus Crickella equi]
MARAKKVKPKVNTSKLKSSVIGRIAGSYDMTVLGMVLILSIFGVAMVFSAGYYSTVNSSDPNPLYFLMRQSFWVLTGLFILLVVANFDYHKYYKLANVLAIASIVMLLLVLAVGIEVNGARRWLGYGGFRITPSELSKLFMIIFTSVFLSQKESNICSQRGLLILFGTMAAHFALIVKQPNLSTAIVVCAIMLAIMFVAGLDYKWIAGLLAVGVLGTFVILTFMKDTHWYSRLTNWIDPFADAQGEGYQVSQSIIALGNGGVTGLGFGKSIAKNLYLPEPQNDFILAVIGEELGYVGFLVLMLAYLFLLYRLIVVALRATDRLGFYLATGVAVMLGLQVIINVAVVTASMPATGITLPFISYGGSSMWSFMAAMGISLNVSRNSKKKVKQ